jgi:hypothetical protein
MHDLTHGLLACAVYVSCLSTACSHRDGRCQAAAGGRRPDPESDPVRSILLSIPLCQGSNGARCRCRGIQARERVLTLTFERKCEQRRLAGLALQFTLPLRTPEIVRTSCLRVLVAHRKTPLQLAFKSPTWHEEHQLLQIYVRDSIALYLSGWWLTLLPLCLDGAESREQAEGAAPVVAAAHGPDGKYQTAQEAPQCSAAETVHQSLPPSAEREEHAHVDSAGWFTQASESDKWATTTNAHRLPNKLSPSESGNSRLKHLF